MICLRSCNSKFWSQGGKNQGTSFQINGSFDHSMPPLNIGLFNLFSVAPCQEYNGIRYCR